jgi:hypothetical protein
MSAGKGPRPRPYNVATFIQGYERAFRRPRRNRNQALTKNAHPKK